MQLQQGYCHATRFTFYNTRSLEQLYKLYIWCHLPPPRPIDFLHQSSTSNPYLCWRKRKMVVLKMKANAEVQIRAIATWQKPSLRKDITLEIMWTGKFSFFGANDLIYCTSHWHIFVDSLWIIDWLSLFHLWNKVRNY